MNSVYLSCGRQKSLYPSARDENFDSGEQTVAFCEIFVPALWLAIFRPEDLRDEAIHDDEGNPVEVRAPLIARRFAGKRLREGVRRVRTLTSFGRELTGYADGLTEAIQDIESEFKYLTIEWDEVASMSDAAHFYELVETVLRYIDGDDSIEADARTALLELTELHVDRRLPKIRQFRDDDDETLEDEDWENLARMVGDELERPVPWLPPSAPPEPVLSELYQCLKEMNVDGVREFLRNGGDPNEPDRDGRLPLKSVFYRFDHHYEKRDQLREIVVTLIDAGHQVNGEVVAEAANHCPLEFFQRLLETVDNVNECRNRYGYPILHCACSCREAALEKCRLLLERGADVNDRGTPYSKTSILWRTVYCDRIDLARLFIEHGAESKGAREALHVVRSQEHLQGRTDWIELLETHRKAGVKAVRKYGTSKS